MVTLLVILFFFLIIGSTWWFGLWNNFITLINFLIASLIASSFYETVAIELAAAIPDYSALADFLAVWLVFLIAFVICRTVTDVLSKKKMKFDIVTEMTGRSILSIWIACVFTAFTLFTFHMAPWHPDAFQKDPETSTLGIGPDRMWLAFIQSRSRGALSESPKKNFMLKAYPKSTHPDDQGLEARVFDPNAKFIDQWHKKREQLSKTDSFRG